jgi:hypothetical protein
MQMACAIRHRDIFFVVVEFICNNCGTLYCILYINERGGVLNVVLFNDFCVRGLDSFHDSKSSVNHVLLSSDGIFQVTHAVRYC